MGGGVDTSQSVGVGCFSPLAKLPEMIACPKGLLPVSAISCLL